MGKRLNFKALQAAVRDAARNAFSEVRANHPNDTFYAYALYTTDGGDYLVPTSNSEEGLRRVMKQYASKSEDSTVNELSLRWSAPDWPYHTEGERHFNVVEELLANGPSIYDLSDSAAERHVNKLMQAFIGGLLDLDEEGFFGKDKERDRVVLLIMMGDQDRNFLLECAKKLNPPGVYERFAKPLQHQTIGTFTEIGSCKVYTTLDVGISQDGHTLATAGENEIFAFSIPGYAEILNKQTGDFQGHMYFVWCCALAPNGTQLAAGWMSGTPEGMGGIERWSLQRKARLPAMPAYKGGIWTVAYSPDSQLLASGGHDKTIRLWSVSNGHLIRELHGHADAVRCVAFSPDGMTLASIDRQPHSLRLWRVATSELLAQCDDGGEYLAFSPDGKLLAVVFGYGSGNSSTVRIWNIEPMQSEPIMIDITHRADAVTFSPDSQYVAVGGTLPGIAELWSVVEKKCIATLDPGYESIHGLAFIDANTIAVTGRGFSRPPILLWDISRPD